MNKELHFSSAKDDWTTPSWLFNLLDKKYNFTVDLFASNENSLCPKYLTNCFEQGDLITKDDVCFGNPPYRRAKPTTWDFVKWAKDYKSVLLLPGRIDTLGFHNYCLPDKCGWHIIKGRLKFGGNTDSAPFPSIVVVFNGSKGILETIDTRRKTWVQK